MRPHIINIAIKTAKKSEYPVFKHGAVLESGGRVLAKSPNIQKSRTPDASMSVHAEVAALKRLVTKGRLKKGISANIYVARVSPAEKTVLSKPCPRCLKALRESGMVRSIYYSMNDGSWQEFKI